MPMTVNPAVIEIIAYLHAFFISSPCCFVWMQNHQNLATSRVTEQRALPVIFSSSAPFAAT
jgi:hypothetical protein